MRSYVATFHFVFSIALGAVLLGLGWLTAVSDQPNRADLLALHVSLAVVAAGALPVLIVLRLLAPPLHPADWPRWRVTAAALADFVVYLSFAAAIGSGLLWSAYGGTPLAVFGAGLPAWNLVDEPLARLFGPLLNSALGAGLSETMASDFFLSAHGVFAGLLALAIVVRLLVAFVRLPAARPRAPLPVPAAAQSELAAGVAGRLRIFGWIQFWLQLAIALASGVLLQFATSGRAFSPGASGLADPIYWSLYGFVLLCAAAALAFYYTRAAKGVALRGDYLDEARKTAFWFLGLGLLVGIAGTVASFVGVSLSITLLVAKTVSQPPGIAITDPNKIIRALDVFVLLVSFNLLLAHFIGTGVAVWLGAGASNARHSYAARALRVEDASA